MSKKMIGTIEGIPHSHFFKNLLLNGTQENQWLGRFHGFSQYDNTFYGKKVLRHFVYLFYHQIIYFGESSAPSMILFCRIFSHCVLR